MQNQKPHSQLASSATAFTLTELLVVVMVIGLLVAVRVPALCRSKPPVQLVQCLSNCRQLGMAAMLYRNDNGDAYPYGERVTYGAYVLDPTGWPMQLLRYMGGSSNAQPKVFRCPSEKTFAETWPIQLHYQANRVWVSDTSSTDQPIHGAEMRKPAIIWLFMDKGPFDFATVRPGSLANPILVGWNMPPGSPQYRRHSGGVGAVAGDGHADWLLLPPYQPSRPSPLDFLELGDCANGQNPASSWSPNTTRAKLFFRYSTTGF
jgi:type II secretory pathway pseudopilin PulG